MYKQPSLFHNITYIIPWQKCSRAVSKEIIKEIPQVSQVFCFGQVKVSLTYALKWQIQLSCYVLSHIFRFFFTKPNSVKNYKIQQQMQNPFFVAPIGSFGALLGTQNVVLHPP